MGSLREKLEDTVSAIGVKLLVFVLLIGVLFTAAVASLQFALDSRREMREIDQLFSRIGASYLPALSLSVFEFDTEQTRLLLEGIRLSGDIAYATVEEVRGDDYMSLLSVGPGPPRNARTQSFPLRVTYQGEEREVGRLTVHVDAEAIRSRLLDQATTLVLTNGVQVLAVALIIFLVVQRSVVRHLRRTAGFVRGLELPTTATSTLQLNKRSYGSRDEIDDIADSINEMTARLGETYGDLAETKDLLQRSASEKETLLRELFHRTKNNMQVIMSMLALKASEHEGNPGVQELAAAIDSQIKAMALVHENLYRSDDLSHLDLADYLAELSSYVVNSMVDVSTPEPVTEASGGIHLDLRLEHRKILLDTAVPCGLVVTELLTNAVKHGFPSTWEAADAAPGAAPSTADRPTEDRPTEDRPTADRQPTITLISATDDAGRLRVEVRDNGVGPPPDFDPRRDGNMGIESVFAIAEQQLGGEVEFVADGGLTCRIRFTDLLYSERV